MSMKPDDIRELEGKIARLRNHSDAKQVSSSPCINAGFGMRIAVELLSAVVVGGAMGYVFDELMHTYPFCLIVFLLFGGAAGFLNVYRLAKAYDEAKKNGGE